MIFPMLITLSPPSPHMPLHNDALCFNNISLNFQPRGHMNERYADDQILMFIAMYQCDKNHLFYLGNRYSTSISKHLNQILLLLCTHKLFNIFTPMQLI